MYYHIVMIHCCLESKSAFLYNFAVLYSYMQYVICCREYIFSYCTTCSWLQSVNHPSSLTNERLKSVCTAQFDCYRTTRNVRAEVPRQMTFLNVTRSRDWSITNTFLKRTIYTSHTYVLAEMWTRIIISCLALMRSAIIRSVCLLQADLKVSRIHEATESWYK